MAGERTEQATQHRREKAREQGDILHSRELTSAAGTLAGAMMLGVMGMRPSEVWRGAALGACGDDADAVRLPEAGAGYAFAGSDADAGGGRGGAGGGGAAD